MRYRQQRTITTQHNRGRVEQRNGESRSENGKGKGKLESTERQKGAFFFFFKDFHSEEVMKVFSIFFWEREGTWKKTHAVDRGQSRS